MLCPLEVIQKLNAVILFYCIGSPPNELLYARVYACLGIESLLHFLDHFNYVCLTLSGLQALTSEWRHESMHVCTP